MSDLVKLSISECQILLKNHEITASELVESYISEIYKSNNTLNAYVKITEEKAREMASKSDIMLLRNEGRSLEGIPVGIKDNFATYGIHTQACSYILKNFKPRYESTVTSQLWNNGAIILGKLNMDEFAMGSSNETSLYGPAINPWKAIGSNKKLVPGGSSGGVAAAVSANLCSGAIGSDTGGSIRQPASFTGTVGIKPTYGRCSRWGMIAFSSSLDQAGPIARNVRDCAILLKTIASFDNKDSTSINCSIPDYEKFLGKSIRDMKIGIPREYQIDNLSEDVSNAWEKGINCLKNAGAQIIYISLPHTKYAISTYYIISSAEASSNLARYDGVKYGLRVLGKDIQSMYQKTRSFGFGYEVKKRILLGTYILSEECYQNYYLKAQKIRSFIRNDFDKVFENGIDAIFTPTTLSDAFSISDTESIKEYDPISMYLNDIFTVTVNISGLPGISIPYGLSKKGLPLGLQIIGPSFFEEKLFQIGYILEQSIEKCFPKKWW